MIQTHRINRQTMATATLALMLGGCASMHRQINLPVAESVQTTSISPSPASEKNKVNVQVDPAVRSTIVAGQAPLPHTTNNIRISPRSGDISLNFPAADVQTVTKAVLGDLLKLQYTLNPEVHAPVTLVTQRPVARTSVLAMFEEALKAANFALVPRGGTYTVEAIDIAKGQSTVVNSQSTGFGTETIQLKFVGAEEMRKLLEPILPGVVTKTEGSENTLVVSGTSGQRNSVRELLKQFDVNWLRNMSFGMFVPQRTDSRLIVPELEKLLNGNGAPTKGLVRLISMERLNGILAISSQAQYLNDVKRWIEILDREGQNNEKRLFVYRVQNGRSGDIAKVINNAFGNGSSSGDDAPKEPFATGSLGNAASSIGSANAADTQNNNYNRYNSRRGTGNQSSVPGNTIGRSNSLSDTANNVNAAVETGIRAKITSDETNNAIIVFGTPHDYAIVEDALRKLDVLPYQVMIEAAVTEVTLTNALRYGVQWSFQKGDANFTLGGAPGAAGQGTTFPPTTGNTTSTLNTIANLARTFPGLSTFYSNGSSISATLEALEGLTTIKVISAPKLLVLNNQTAALQVGNQVPISTGSASTIGNANPTVANSIEYKDTGVILKITPRVNSGGLVLLDVAQEVSQVTNDTNNTSQTAIASPVISTRKIATTVAVQDGQIIALGGLISESSNKGKSGLPFLSRIPVIGGFLFGNNNSNIGRTELLVLLRPRVIRTPDDAHAVTEELESKLRLVQPIIKKERLP